MCADVLGDDAVQPSGGSACVYPLLPLRDFPDLSRLPSGYFGMFPLAYIPSLWLRVVVTRMLALPRVPRGLNKANMDPGRSIETLARRGIRTR